QRALRFRRPGAYQVQAAIAALHAEAATAAATDWQQIAALYGELARLQPTPVVRLNHAVAVAMAGGVGEGLTLRERIGASGELDRYHLYHAARADLSRRLGRNEDAAKAYQEALALTFNAIERRYLRRRLSEVQPRIEKR